MQIWQEIALFLSRYDAQLRRKEYTLIRGTFSETRKRKSKMMWSDITAINLQSVGLFREMVSRYE